MSSLELQGLDVSHNAQIYKEIRTPEQMDFSSRKCGPRMLLYTSIYSTCEGMQFLPTLTYTHHKKQQHRNQKDMWNKNASLTHAYLLTPRLHKYKI